MEKVVIMFDFDGTILNVMGRYVTLAVKMTGKYFGVPKREAQKKYLTTIGHPFPEQLRMSIPHADPLIIQKCNEEYESRWEKEVYETADIFKDVKPALQMLKEKGYELIISSTNTEERLERLLKKFGLREFFSKVYGKTDGKKADHIRLVQQAKNPKIIAFVGDTQTDVNLRREGSGPNVVTIGRAGSKRFGMKNRRVLIKMGATIATTDLRHLAHLDLEKVLEHAKQGKRYRRSPTEFGRMI